MQTFWNFVTDFGDTAVTLPLAALTVVFLLISRWPRAALLFALSLAGCGLAIGLVKLALESCGRPLLHTDITNPSGHAAVSMTVYGALATLFGRNASIERRWIPGAAGIILLAGITASRVVLDTHSPVEVVIGLVIGLVALAVFYRALIMSPPVKFQSLWLAVAALAVVATMHGTRWPIEEVVRNIARLIRHTVPGCA